jgi:hypothetical protein
LEKKASSWTDKEHVKMAKKLDVANLVKTATLPDQYQKQLDRIKNDGNIIDMIDEAVKGVLDNLPKAKGNSLVIYGDPQSGKTELMICLTARLLDAGHHSIVHLVTDSVDLLGQNLDRFKLAGLAPAPRNATDVAATPITKGHNALLFCKKNARDPRVFFGCVGSFRNAESSSGRPIVVVAKAGCDPVAPTR